jgi:hypothetical protein
VAGSDPVTPLAEALLGHVVSLCTLPPCRRPEHVGTGLLLEMNGQYFIVSARHVLDEVKSLFFYMKERSTRKLTGQLVLGRLERGAVDRIDVAVLRLEGPHLPPYEEAGIKCLQDLSMIHPSALPRHGTASSIS